MNLFDVTSVEELKKLGKLSEVRAQLSIIVGPNIKFKASSWLNLFTSIQSIKKLISLGSNDEDAQKKCNDLYFKGDAERLIYTLLDLDGKTRLDKLGVNRTHYSKKEIADKWRKEISKVIHPDVCVHPNASSAMAELNEMYKEMVK